MVQVTTNLSPKDYDRLQKAIKGGRLTQNLYSFAKDAILEKMNRENI